MKPAARSGSDGSNAVGSVAIDGAGILYGTTFLGGQDNKGVIWKIAQ